MNTTKKTLSVLALVILVGACNKPTVTKAKAPAPAASALSAEKPPTVAPATATPAPAAPTTAAPLTNAIIDHYIAHLSPIVAGLRASDPRFASAYKGTAVRFADLITPESAPAREALAKANGYASWAAFNEVHDGVVGAMAVLVARTLQMMNVGANFNRLAELKKKLKDPGLHPEERARLAEIGTKITARNEELRKRTMGSDKVPEANIDLAGKRQADISAAFKATRLVSKKSSTKPQAD